MKLVLAKPPGKGYILYVNELKGDEKYVPYEPCYSRLPDSERWDADRTIRDAWEEVKAPGVSGSIFNQCQWVGTTGWEFWVESFEAILATATKVSDRLGVELRIEKNVEQHTSGTTNDTVISIYHPIAKESTMSNKSNQTDQSNTKAPAFKATFIAANNGLQTEQRVHGRRAFPSRNGQQPQLGETWMVEVAGENPKGTVHFVKCIELVSAAKPVATSDSSAVSSTKEPAVSKAEPVKPAIQVKIVRAPGNDVCARVTAWATPAKTVGLGDLKFAFAQKRIESDETARSMFTQLGSTMATVKALQEIADNAAGQLKQVNSNDYDIGLELFNARKVMVQMNVAKADLNKETLAYGRLVQKLNATPAGEEHDKLALSNAATKEALDSKRAAHNAAMATAKENLANAEHVFHFSYAEDCVMAVLDLLETKVNYSEQAASNRNQLEADLDAFEKYVAALS
ncbi:MAG: hypothetical protein WC028_22915 [Candidatus Obscuribacterales bacterium]|jgi:hypothetical protein